jgi:multimeric flavodoxin WrbA
LNAYLEGAASVGLDTQFIYLNGLSYKGCQACDRCVKGQPCLIEDDLNDIFPVLERAAIWALASPIYYDGVSGQLKTFYDRLRFTTYEPHKLEGLRRGIVIVTYEDDETEEYRKVAGALAKYLNWHDRGDFGEIKIVAESNLGPKDAWKSRPEVLDRLNQYGIEHAREILALG